MSVPGTTKVRIEEAYYDLDTGVITLIE